MTKIFTDTFQCLDRITVENREVSFSVLPQIGGKMISLVCKGTGREFMSLSGRKFRPLRYGDDFGDCDISGFDECFPAIAEGVYPDWPWKGIVVPDHGELWTLPWKCETKADRLIMSAHGVRFPYWFTKEMSVEANRVCARYTLRNLSPYEFRYIWSAHPLLAVTPGSRIILPGSPRIRTDFSKHERFGELLYETSWPEARQADGAVVDLSVIRSADEDQATKVFTTRLEEGWCALHDRKTGDFIKLSFPVDRIPYVGLWINEGGWPFDGKPSFNVALEPCTGCPDKLETAVQRGEYASIRGLGEVSWTLEITLGRSESPVFG